MSAAFARPARRRANQATLRPWVKPQAGVTKTRRQNADGSVTILRTEIDHRGVVRRTETTVSFG